MANKNTNFLWHTAQGGIYCADMIDVVERPPKYNGRAVSPAVKIDGRV